MLMPYPINQRAHQFNSIQSVPVSFGLWDTALKFLSPGPRSDVTDHLEKDDRSKAENYRGITLLSALGKHFTSILNDRLYDYITKKGVLKAEQGVFKKRHGTVDSIFILKTLIDKFVKSKPQKRRNLLFSCFVDFRKAFDRIPRQKLFEKLRKEGIKGCFFRNSNVHVLKR